MTQEKHAYLMFLFTTLYGNGIDVGFAKARNNHSEYKIARRKAKNCLDYIAEALNEEVENDIRTSK